MDGYAFLAVINYFLIIQKVIRIELKKKTKRSILSMMYKHDLDKIAKEKGIKRNKTKAEMIETLVEKLKLDDVRKYYSEIFKTEGFDVLKHNLVPPHRVMSEEEKEELKKKYRLLRFKQLPRIKVTDPAVISIGGLIGDVIEITRKSSTAGKIKYYRVVVK